MRRATEIIIIFVTAALLLWDLLVFIHPEPGDTISEVIKHWSYTVSFIPFSAGILMGHWFWPTDTGEDEIPWLILMMLAVLTNDFLKVLQLPMMVWVAFGVLVGHWLWPQKANKEDTSESL